VVLPELDLIAGRTNVFRDHLAEPENCFGKHYAKTAPECKKCLCPVVHEGHVWLLNEVCANLCGTAAPSNLKRLSSQEVQERLTHKTVEEIFKEILNESNPEINGSAARQLLYDRLWHLRTHLGVPTPPVPSLKVLVASVG